MTVTDDGVHLALAGVAAAHGSDQWAALVDAWHGIPEHVKIAALIAACASLPTGITDKQLRQNGAGALIPRRKPGWIPEYEDGIPVRMAWEDGSQ